MAADTEKKVACVHCNQLPGYTTLCGDGDEVYHALECDCKTTPYMRSQTLVRATWETTTFKLTPKEAFDAAEKDKPAFIQIYRPAHAQ